MDKVKLSDLLGYIKKNNLDKREAMYMLNLYNYYKKNGDMTEEEFNMLLCDVVSVSGILNCIKLINKSFMDASKNKVVLGKMDDELELIDELLASKKKEDIIKAYFKSCMLLHDEQMDENVDSKNKALELKLRLENNNDINR